MLSLFWCLVGGKSSMMTLGGGRRCFRRELTRGTENGGPRRRYAGRETAPVPPSGGFESSPWGERTVKKRAKECSHQKTQGGKLYCKMWRHGWRGLTLTRRLADALSRADNWVSLLPSAGVELSRLTSCWGKCVFALCRVWVLFWLCITVRLGARLEVQSTYWLIVNTVFVWCCLVSQLASVANAASWAVASATG